MAGHHQVSQFSFDPEREIHSLSIQLATAMGRVLDTPPSDLPPLYDAVDPDALDTLFAPPPKSKSESSPAYPAEIVFSWCERGVRIRQTGDITITDQPVTPSLDSNIPPDGFAGTSADDAPPAYHAYPQAGDLATAVVLAVAEIADNDPSTVRERLADRIDPEALTALFRPTSGGASRAAGSVSFAFEGYLVTVTTTGLVTLVSDLEQLKHDGGNVLVVGDVPDAVFDMAREFLCGTSASDVTPTRHQLRALLERSPTDSQHLGTRAPAVGEQTEILTHQNHAAVRSTASSECTHDSGEHVTAVTGGLVEFRRAVIQRLATTDRESVDDERDGCWLFVDSLRPLLVDTAIDERAFLAPLCRAVRGAGALGYYFVPRERETAGVESVESVVDAVVELRVSPCGPEQRWHLHQTGYSTEWFALEC